MPPSGFGLVLKDKVADGRRLLFNFCIDFGVHFGLFLFDDAVRVLVLVFILLVVASALGSALRLDKRRHFIEKYV